MYKIVTQERKEMLGINQQNSFQTGGRRSFLYLTNGLLRAINDASKFFIARSLIGAGIKTFHVNACIGLLFKCLDGSHILLMSKCSSHVHTPLYIGQAGWGFLLFK